MDYNWDEILAELQKTAEELKKTTNEQQEQQEQEEPQQQEAIQSSYNVDEIPLEYWMNIGRQMFTLKYGRMPNFRRYLPIIEQRAISYLQQDYQAGKAKNDYFLYLEQALKDTFNEARTISQDFSSMARYIGITQLRQPEKFYTTEDYHEDYKDMLEKITVKDVAVIRFDDGSKKGYWGTPQLDLNQPPKID